MSSLRKHTRGLVFLNNRRTFMIRYGLRRLVSNQAQEICNSDLYRKLLYRANHRGMLENEIILTSFIKERFSELDGDQMKLLERLLDEPDPQMFKWFTGSAQPAPQYSDTILFKSIRDHVARSPKAEI